MLEVVNFDDRSAVIISSLAFDSSYVLCSHLLLRLVTSQTHSSVTFFTLISDFLSSRSRVAFILFVT